MDKVYSKRLKELREKRDLKQKDLCDKLNFGYTQYNYWENGKSEPNIETLISLSSFYGVSIDYIVGARNDLNLNLITIDANKKVGNNQRLIRDVDYAKRLKELRKSKNLSQEELSKNIGIARGRYVQFELGNNEPNIEVFKKLSSFYGVSVDYIMGIKDDLNYDMFLNIFRNFDDKQQTSIIHMLNEFCIVNK